MFADRGHEEPTLESRAEERLAAAGADMEHSAQPSRTTTTATVTDRLKPHAHDDDDDGPVGCARMNGAPSPNKHGGPSSSSSPLERVFTLLLPFVFVFLLPTIRLSTTRDDGTTGAARGLSEEAQEHLFDAATTSRATTTTGDLLLALIRLPLDKIRLQSAGVGLGADAKEIISSKGDLQEEETHMMLVAPAEHRASYANGQYYNQGGAASESNSQPHGADAHAQVVPAPNDYGVNPDGGTDQPGGGGGESAATVAETSGAAHSGGSALQTRSDLPAVRALNVKCEKNHMTVNIVFDRPFYGMVFSKGHYNDQKCVHLPPNSGQTSVNFDIHLGKCGMSSSDAGNGLQQAGGSSAGLQSGGASNQQQPNGVFIENTIIIQYDPLVQEIYDQARKLRCTWYDYYEKSVTFRPYNVDMLDAVTANFLGDNIQCWMQIQVGKGPWSSEVAGIVKIGQTMTMVLAIKDDENRFDMLVRNCVAHDGKHQPIQLVDEYGCVARPKIMGKFQKVRNFGPAATVVSYAHFQAFKFPDSMNVHFQCVIQVCRYECPEPVCAQPARGELPPGSGSGGTSGGSPTGAPMGDYATSGTEMVASKELVPHQAIYYSGGGGGANQSHQLHHPHQHHGSNVNLKLDESQGRVQVKLDTSMMASLGSNGRPPVAAAPPAHMGGPLPPHLLHSAGHHPQQTEQRGYTGPNLYRPAVAASPVGAAHTRHPASSALSAVSPSGRSQPAHDQQQVVSFSPQFPLSQAAAASRRSAIYASRLGEVASSNTTTSEAAAGDNQNAGGGENQRQAGKLLQQQHPLDQLAPYEAEYPLSLIASPRGFLLGSMVGHGAARPSNHLHRVKREGSHAAARRHARHLRQQPDSTSVQTHKSIQVVSPDDVAFSLLEPEESATERGAGAQQAGPARRRLASVEQAASSVCFSASRFIWTMLVTLAALVSGVAIVTYVILRQRSQLEKKLSAVYPTSDQFQPPPGLSFNYNHPPAAMVSQCVAPSSAGGSGHFGGVALDQQHQHQVAAQRRTTCSATPEQANKRQREEAQQRNKYLARLYSQFSPASYWRQ